MRCCAVAEAYAVCFAWWFAYKRANYNLMKMGAVRTFTYCVDDKPRPSGIDLDFKMCVYVRFFN